jgi:hypothetical protein
MRYPLLYITAIIFLFSILSSCRDKTPETNTTKPGRDQLVDINKELIIKDRERILAYIGRKGLELDETETGLWYKIEVPGTGSIEPGDEVIIEYELSLLDGTLCYSSEKDGALTFTVDRSDIPAGLNEGIQLLGSGGKAMLIIPSYIGYGMIGDETRIPARSVLVYRLQVIDIN